MANFDGWHEAEYQAEIIRLRADSAMLKWITERVNSETGNSVARMGQCADSARVDKLERLLRRMHEKATEALIVPCRFLVKGPSEYHRQVTMTAWINGHDSLREAIDDVKEEE